MDKKALTTQDKSEGKGKGKPSKCKAKKEKLDERANSFDEDSKKKRKHEKKCSYCDEPGHFAKDNRKKKADQKGKGASSESREQKCDAYVMEELFLMTSPRVAEVRYV